VIEGSRSGSGSATLLFTINKKHILLSKTSFPLKFDLFFEAEIILLLFLRGEKFPVQRSREPVKVMMNVSIISFPEVNTLGKQNTLTSFHENYTLMKSHATVRLKFLLFFLGRFELPGGFCHLHAVDRSETHLPESKGQASLC
jgi:hypothetical protein